MSDGLLMNRALGIEAQAGAQDGMCLGLYGKHPARGDFIHSGVAPDLLHHIEGWLDTVMPMVKASLAADWEPVWDQKAAARPVIAFWLGEEIWGEVVAGVMAPSCDKVGRRFPLVFLACGPAETALPAPVTDQSQHWYAAMATGLHQALDEAKFLTPDDLLAGLAVPNPDQTIAPAPSDFWAIRQDSDVTTLLADIVQTDHRRALVGRSYWWRAGNLPPVDERQVSPAPTPAAEDAATAPSAADPAPVAGGLDVEAAIALAEGALAPPLSSADGSAELPASFDPDLSINPLLADIPPTQSLDQTLSQTVQEPQRLSQVYAGKGLPSADVLAWLLRGAS
jgi:type VI secretion system protein ImpM